MSIRGYFAVGVEGINKAGNVGAILRTAHAFGASFFFTIAPTYDERELRAVDTSEAEGHLPVFTYPTREEFALPSGCQLVGVELTDESVELPSFRHPLRAAYVLGPERGSLSPEITARCDHVVKIPTKFCINVGMAAGIVMYDRMISLGRFAERPVRAGGPLEPLKPHVQGRLKVRTGKV